MNFHERYDQVPMYILRKGVKAQAMARMYRSYENMAFATIIIIEVVSLCEDYCSKSFRWKYKRVFEKVEL